VANVDPGVLKFVSASKVELIQIKFKNPTMVFQENVKNLVILARSILLRFKEKCPPVKIRPMSHCQPRKSSGVSNLSGTGLFRILEISIAQAYLLIVSPLEFEIFYRKIGLRKRRDDHENFHSHCTGTCGCAPSSKCCLLRLPYFWKVGASSFVYPE